MKKKKVLILFLRNGDFKKEIEREITHDKIVSDLVEKGIKVHSKTSSLGTVRTTFQDGSTVASAGVGEHLKGGRYTHLYVEKGLDADGLIKSGLFTLLNGEFEDWETEGDRMFTYSVDGNRVNIEKY